MIKKKKIIWNDLLDKLVNLIIQNVCMKCQLILSKNTSFSETVIYDPATIVN